MAKPAVSRLFQHTSPPKPLRHSAELKAKLARPSMEYHRKVPLRLGANKKRPDLPLCYESNATLICFGLVSSRLGIEIFRTPSL